MSLYPNFRQAFREGIHYLKLSDDAEEKKEQEKKLGELEYKMDDLGRTLDNEVGAVFSTMNTMLDSAKLGITSEQKRAIKMKVLDNMKQGAYRS